MTNDTETDTDGELDGTRTADDYHDADETPDEAEVVFTIDGARMLKLILRTAGEKKATINEWKRVVQDSGATEHFDQQYVGRVVSAAEAAKPEDEPTPGELLRNFGPRDRRWTGTADEYIALNTAVTTWKMAQGQQNRSIEGHEKTLISIFNKIRDGMSEVTGREMGTFEESMADMLGVDDDDYRPRGGSA